MRYLPRLSGDTVRRFMFELVVVTTGILIALSIDGFMERRRNDALVREAHASIGREIADNLRDLEVHLPVLKTHEEELATASRLVDDLLGSGKSDITKWSVTYNLATLKRGSWQAAERSGALAYMAYADLQAYSEIYSVQELFVDSQRDTIARMAGLLGLVATGDPEHAPRQDLELARSRLLDARAGLFIHAQLAQGLVKSYKDLRVADRP